MNLADALLLNGYTEADLAALPDWVTSGVIDED